MALLLKMMWMFLTIAWTYSSFLGSNAFSPVEDRVAVTISSGDKVVFARTPFSGGENATIYAATLSPQGSMAKLSRYSVTGLKEAIVSNPTAGDRVSNCFVMTSGGQVYEISWDEQKGITASLVGGGAKLPSGIPVKQFSNDPVQVVLLGTVTFVFARSQAVPSLLYFTHRNGTGPWSPWAIVVKDSVSLQYDVYAAVNGFLNRIEVFAVVDDGSLVHTWQTGPFSFEESFHKLTLFPPKFTSAPVVQQMGHSDFNGVLCVFARGDDGVVHHLQQTTCDKVENPWGPCTWGVAFAKIGGKIPSDAKSENPLVGSHNIHLGLEVFAVGEKGLLYHIWQSERDRKWSDWEELGTLAGSLSYATIPSVILEDYGWWKSIAVGSDGNVHAYQEPKSFKLNTTSVHFGNNVTVSWAVPLDEATSKDWIGVYPSGSNNSFYVDFKYVGGTQNPLADPVPKGNLNFEVRLPNGKYDVRYLVNKEYKDVLGASLAVDNATSESEWMQLYKGMSKGLGVEAFDFDKCVEDGNRTVDAFRLAFKAFEDREVIKGLHLIAQGLTDFRDALVLCEQTDIVKALTEFIEDLIACTEGDCEKFVIEIAKELLIFYERHYEIYGDIRAATNCFKIDAYEQGGICIGRVTAACIENPSID